MHSFLPDSARVERVVDRFQAMAAFVKAAESGSLSAASRALGISLASVSRQVSSLEAQLGAQLLIRTTRRLALTESGRLYYESARHILGEVAETELALTARVAVPSGRLHVSAPTLIGRRHLAPLLPAFLRRHPQVSVDLMLVDRAVSLVEEGVDLAIAIGRLEDSSVIARKLGTLRMVVCAAPDYLELRGEPQTPDALKDHDCLVFAASPADAEWRFQVAGHTVRIQVPARLHANALDAVVATALGGAGLVRAPSWLVAEPIAAGRLRIVLDAYERPPSDIHALFLPTRLLSAKLRAFTDFLVEAWGSIDLGGAAMAQRRAVDYS